MRHKFHAKPVEIDDIKFSSKLEGRYYQKLKLAKKSGDLLFFLRQVPFHLPGKTKYVVDFVEFWKDGSILFTDCKGMVTEIFSLKKRQVEELYPITLNIVTKV